MVCIFRTPWRRGRFWGGESDRNEDPVIDQSQSVERLLAWRTVSDGVGGYRGPGECICVQCTVPNKS
jgi:hypothetical protein